MRVLVLGGYGNFGARIARALAGDPALQLLVGGRDGGKAAEFAARLGGGAQGLAIDMAAADFATQLRRHTVGLLIHTAGPFQQQDYGVAEAAAATGAHYLDLADGRRFVCDFQARLDARFRACGRVAISGASTVPALSSAVIDALSDGWQRLDQIDICIAPAQTAPRGLATMAAVLSYCGATIQVWQDGRWLARTGWAAPVERRFARLKPRLAALCDIPDLELLPAH
ncbi:MAG TPA: saccharopine dehydrogenase NADP-binding domain-containing protein, partial [Roseateles sp.]|nr:saccharopine dehydrogenase NADP-binding domain-containing protein [Roseateles sp.]